MSVPKNERTESKVAFFDNAYMLYDNIVKFLISDFGIKEYSRDAKVFCNRVKMADDDAAVFGDLVDRYHLDLESDYPRWLIEYYRTQILNHLSSTMTSMNLAFGLYPNSEDEWYMKRRYQNEAIGYWNCVKNTLTLALRVFPINLEKYTPYIMQIDEELKKIKVWRAGCNKTRQVCIMNDIAAYEKGEKAYRNKHHRQITKGEQKPLGVYERIELLKDPNSKIEVDNEMLTVMYHNYLAYNADPNAFNEPPMMPALLRLDEYGNVIGPMY